MIAERRTWREIRLHRTRRILSGRALYECRGLYVLGVPVWISRRVMG